ncbi:hypothetical protein EZV62_025794 [Acer yangbiense]|uniref:Uncharacterized protein n=1 Tax=Acer yangbiense TaxID=1000413 RepID=A0A5C7GZF9_9ROSI|nr:hypothetical protein EZV62_025794 [Acer yangbiense]
MELKEVLCMSKGEGKSSFLHNSGLTRKVAVKSKPILERAVESLFTENPSLPFQVLNAADLGCSSGPNSFSVMSTVIQSVENKCRELNKHFKIPEFQFYLNDLPGNDFNTVFKGLSSFVGEKHKNVSCFVMGAPGSFHGRLFPRNTMHLVHSSYGAHWLSKVPELRDEERLPINKGKIYISKTSPPAVSEAYLAQFQQDFSFFLKSRAQEMVADSGRVVLVLHGRLSADPTSEDSYTPWELFAEAISHLVSKGLIDEERLDSFDVPYYTPSQEEVKELIDKEGSFAVDLMETFAIDIGDKDIWSDATRYANNIRSFTEPMISHHFGVKILDELYDEITDLIVQDFASQTEPDKIINIVVVLKRKK